MAVTFKIKDLLAAEATKILSDPTHEAYSSDIDDPRYRVQELAAYILNNNTEINTLITRGLAFELASILTASFKADSGDRVIQKD